MNNIKIDKVHSFWNSESCGERYALGNTTREKFLNEEKTRYRLEPYIQDFGNFSDFENKNVLEIGVGFGCDHSQIARQNPKTLTGVDLTERAIHNTKLRFKSFGLKSVLKIDNAEKLSFKNNSFDAIYSWGVLHHSPNTEKCFEELYRVLKPGGFAKIMIYHKYSLVGFMLWLKYGLAKFKPLTNLDTIYSKHLESPGTKAFTINETKEMVKKFSNSEIAVQLCFGDLLQGDIGINHKGLALNIAKFIYPRLIVKTIAKFLPIGLYLLIKVEK